ncbi:hypothetical protein NIES4101_57220 [Calothrix sp. NIES-4101]|nr:hypothetical protein NIES4101_57220 [Calothrix sp. NIES-4101]
MDCHQNQKVLVHCAANMRVSACIYLYRCLQQGINENEAKQALYKIWKPNEVWQILINHVLEIYLCS